MLSKIFFPAGVDKTISRVSLYWACFVRTHLKKIVWFCCPLSRAHSPGHIPQVDNRTNRQHDVTTLPPISISRQHRAYVTRPCALYCCACYNNVHRSLRSVIHHLYLSAAAVCNRSTLTVAGNVRIIRTKYQYLNCINFPRF